MRPPIQTTGSGPDTAGRLLPGPAHRAGGRAGEPAPAEPGRDADERDADGPSDPSLALIETLERLGAIPPRDSEDPMLRMLRQAIERDAGRRRAAGAPAESAPLARLREENRRLRDQCALLAAAVGACPECWGADRRCPDCRGRGRAGHVTPDEACFAHYVLPALRRVMGTAPTLPVLAPRPAAAPARGPAAPPVSTRTQTPNPTQGD